MFEMPVNDPYVVLGLQKTAQATQIRTAYRKLALKYHPDKIKDEALREKGTVEFQKIQQAYELLSDESKRIQYDSRVRATTAAKERMAARGSTMGSGRRGPIFEDITPKDYSAYESTYETKPAPQPSKPYRPPRDLSPVSVDRGPRPSKYPDDECVYEERRSSSRKHAEYERKHHSSKDKDPFEKKYANTATLGSTKVYARRDSSRLYKERAKESTKSSRATNAKVRDKERRRDTSEKYSHNTYSVSVEDYTASDSESDGYSDVTYTIPLRGRRPSEQTTRPKLTRRDAAYNTSWETPKMAADIEGAREYMRQKGGRNRTPTPEIRPNVIYITPLGSRNEDTARRSSARPRMPDRVEVVETPRFSFFGLPTKPRGSASKNPTPTRPPPSLRRSSTLDTSHVEPIVPRSVRKKGNLFDSGYNSPANSPPVNSSGEFLGPSSRPPKIITPSGYGGSSHRRAHSTSPLHREPITIQPTTHFQEFKPSYYQTFTPAQVRYSPRVSVEEVSWGSSAKRPTMFRKTSIVS